MVWVEFTDKYINKVDDVDAGLLGNPSVKVCVFRFVRGRMETGRLFK